MKTDTIAVVMIGLGGILLYSAIKNLNPVDVIKMALKGQKATPVTAGGTNPGATNTGGKGVAGGVKETPKNQPKSLEEYAKGTV